MSREAMSPDTELTALVSRGLYRIVNGVIGHEDIVKLRREQCCINDVLINSIISVPFYTFKMSGSTVEGFEMKTSDVDTMVVLNDVLVLPSYHPLLQDSSPQKCVLIYDTDYTSTGFAVIRRSLIHALISTPSQFQISLSLVWNSLGQCVCSKMFREFQLCFFPSIEIHGPCVSGEMPGGEFDIAFCLQCPYWPREASTFITRSLRSGWPSQQVVTDICNDGCLFVPISSKALHCQDAVEMEWRMPFSLAEKKLIYSMNHCQFLCYGLLKLFLNEVLKKTENIDDLLCSYFMKTAVFWEISEDKSGWTSQSFLCKFWKVFSRLLSWVNVGYCPNFFNPDNNMFAGKIHGLKQRLLMQALRSFHSEGVLCLLKCPSLNSELTMLFNLTSNPRQLNMKSYFQLSLSEELTVSQYKLDTQRMYCFILLNFLLTFGLSYTVMGIRRVRNVNPTSTLMKAAVKYLENKLLLRVGENILAELASANYRSFSNRTVKKYLCTALNIFYRNGSTFCEREIISAKWFFKLRMFYNVIHILSRVKTQLHSSQFMYVWAMNKDGLKRLHRPETSYISFLKSNIAQWVYLIIGNNVSELFLEMQAALNDRTSPCLVVPPVVFVNFLLLLSYHNLGDTIRRNDELRDFNALVWYDEGYHIHRTNRAISWEILGICQQLCGDYHGAYQSYISALNDDLNFFKRATITRICCTISQQLND